MKQLRLDFLVATNRRGIVATIEPAWNRILLSRQKILQLSRQFSAQTPKQHWRSMHKRRKWKRQGQAVESEARVRINKEKAIIARYFSFKG
jgi:hypothetical protein